MLRGKDEVNKKQGKSPGVREQFDTAHIARETIDAKLAAEKLQEISTLINLRFGPGTWQGILEERARRIAEAKEAARLAKIKARKEKEELWADISMILKVMGVIVALGVGIFLLIMYA